MSGSIEQFTFTDGWDDSGGGYAGALSVDYSALKYYGTISVTADAGSATFATGPNGADLTEYLSAGNPTEYYFSIFDSSPTQSATFEWRGQAPVAFDTVQYFSPTYPNGADFGQAFAINGAVNATPACYCSNTLILTNDGERAVETLAVGDMVVTASGEYRPILWVGRRSYAGRFLAANPGVQPVRFGAGALGEGLPKRDLRVSPEHAMVLDGVLVPARCLVNGVTIVQERGLDRVDYVHVELDSHDVLLAEGAASESFIDDCSRGVFHNAAEWAALYPERERSQAIYCAPRVESGAALAAIRRRLDGSGVQDVSLCCDGVQSIPVGPGVRAVRLSSGSGHASGDARRLGVAVSRIEADGVSVPLDDPRLVAGWHGLEDSWRWTDGGALLIVCGAKQLDVTVVALPFQAAA